jgi:nucleoid-associated protein YgaU
VLAIKAAEAEARNLYVAGEAAPGTLVRVYAGEDFVGEAQASEHGTWLVEAQKELPVGDVTIRADAAARSTERATARAELPFVRYADGLVLEPAAAVTAGGGVANVSASVPQPTFVIIRRGDNLWRISKRQYGRGIRYESIFAANRELIRNPDRIYPGQAFVLPQRDRGWESPAN